MDDEEQSEEELPDHDAALDSDTSSDSDASTAPEPVYGALSMHNIGVPATITGIRRRKFRRLAFAFISGKVTAGAKKLLYLKR